MLSASEQKSFDKPPLFDYRVRKQFLRKKLNDALTAQYQATMASPRNAERLNQAVAEIEAGTAAEHGLLGNDSVLVEHCVGRLSTIGKIRIRSGKNHWSEQIQDMDGDAVRVSEDLQSLHKGNPRNNSDICSSCICIVLRYIQGYDKKHKRQAHQTAHIWRVNQGIYP